MTDEPMAPVYHGDYVTYGDRTFLRMRGGDGTEETGNQTPAEQAPNAPAETPASPGQAETPDYFDEKFDPAALPDELRPAYHQMRNAFTGKTQTIAQERQELREAKELHDALRDPEKRIDALERLGIIDTQESGALVEDDESSELEQRLAVLEAERQREQAQTQEAEVEQAKIAYINHGLAELQERTGREFSDKEINRLGRLASITFDAEGLPDVAAAYDELYVDHEAELLARLKAAKQADVPPAGTAPKEDLDFDDPQVSEDYLDARFAQLRAGE